MCFCVPNLSLHNNLPANKAGRAEMERMTNNRETFFCLIFMKCLGSEQIGQINSQHKCRQRPLTSYRRVFVHMVASVSGD